MILDLSGQELTDIKLKEICFDSPNLELLCLDNNRITARSTEFFLELIQKYPSITILIRNNPIRSIDPRLEPYLIYRRSSQINLIKSHVSRRAHRAAYKSEPFRRLMRERKKVYDQRWIDFLQKCAPDVVVDPELAKIIG